MMLVPLAARTANYRFEQISIAQGLSQVTINKIIQDQMGVLWVATYDGLNRYDGYKFRAWHHEPDNPQSLSSSDISDIYEDEDGTLWVGSERATLNKFDRYTGNAIHYKPAPDTPEIMVRGRIKRIIRDGGGRLWMASTGGGVFRLDEEKGLLLPYLNLPDDQQFLPAVLRAVTDIRGNLFLATHRGLFFYDSQSDSFINWADAHPGGLEADGYVRGMWFDPDGVIWMGATGGVFRYDPAAETHEFIPIPYHLPNIPQPKTGYLMRDSRGTLWAGMHRGVFRLTDNGFQCVNEKDISPFRGNPIIAIHEDQLGNIWALSIGIALYLLPAGEKEMVRVTQFLRSSNTYISSTQTIMEDRSGTVWVGTGEGGLFKFESRNQRFRHIAPGEGGLHANGMRGFREDDLGNLWIATQGGGLGYWDRKNHQFTSYMPDDDGSNGLLDFNMVSLHIDPKGRLWAGGKRGLSMLIPGTRRFRGFPLRTEGGLDGRVVAAITDAEDDHLWVVTNVGLHYFDPQTGQADCIKLVQGPTISPNTDPIQIAGDEQGALWISTTNGLFRYDPARAGEIEAYPAEKYGFTSNRTTCLLLDSRETLWIGTWGSGLNRFDTQTGENIQYTTATGLPNNVIYGILEAPDGEIWFSSNRGLCRLDPDTGKLRNYVMTDGLQSNEFNGGASYRTPRGEFIFGGINGFNIFRPEDIIEKTRAPDLLITSITSRQRQLATDVNGEGNIHMSFKEDHLAFEFAALDYTNPKLNMFTFRLQGVDDAWSQPDTRHSISYGNLTPGKFRFMVKGANSDGVWSEQVNVNITITPPFWKSTWFLVLAGLALILLVIFGVRAWRRRLVRLQLEEFRALDLRRKTEELEVARSIQLSMLPKKDLFLDRIELVGRMRPATEVGGDYYDFLELDQGRICAVWGDATGHGMQAGMIAGMTKAALVNAINTRYPDNAGEVVQGLNTTLKTSLAKRDVGMAFGMALLDTRRSRVEICAAGMPFPVHYRAADESLATIPLRCPPLGYIKELPLQTQYLELEPGDALILSSDGFFERFDPGDQLWGDRGVHHTLLQACRNKQTASGIADQLFDECDAFARGRDNHDDMTVVVLRVYASDE